jgi:hypothetical protein
LSLNNGTLRLDVNGNTPEAYDHLEITGSVQLSGTVALNIFLGFDPEDHVDEFHFVMNDGADPVSALGPNARFTYMGNSISEGQMFLVEGPTYSQLFMLNPGTTASHNDITLSAVPEPATGAILCGGVALLLGLRRRRAWTETKAADDLPIS